MAETQSDIETIRGELETVQKALKAQTRRCRQLVAEYTRRLQLKEQQYQGEKALREDQLGKVLRALLIFEARLRQEQKFISHQLEDKDCIIKKQNGHIKKLMSSQYCKNCNQYYSPSPNLESLESSSEYVATDYQDYQSSNFESLDSSSEIYATVSEKSYNTGKSYDNSCSGDEVSKAGSDSSKNLYQKNKFKDSLGRRNKKIPHRKSVGTYFEVLKLRNDSRCSNEDNTSNDYDNLDSLPPESVTDKISVVSDRIENMFQYSQDDLESANNSINNQSLLSDSECQTTIINNEDDGDVKSVNKYNESELLNNKNQDIYADETNENINSEKVECKLSDSIPPFEGDGETNDANDKWYASASDQEDEEQHDIYRDNPVLECVNQILLQNINDNLNSPPKTPATERKNPKVKRVKFSDEEDSKSNDNMLILDSLKDKISDTEGQDYYETPIQKTPNFYETPQSIYSNDYEQILSKSSDIMPIASVNKLENKQEKEINSMASRKLSVAKSAPDPTDKPNHYYIDMDTKSENNDKEPKVARKSKIFRTPPALPPKPSNLTAKHKISNFPDVPIRRKSIDQLESEPDYCSISELNLPTNKNSVTKTSTSKHPSPKKISVIAEVHSLNSNDIKSKLEKPSLINAKVVPINSDYDPVIVTNGIPSLINRNIEKLNIQTARQTFIKPDNSQSLLQSPQKPREPEIPKLPQVSEIIIPEETEEKEVQQEKKDERITIDNYVQNNTQILKTKNGPAENRRGIKIGSSVSSLINDFNKRQVTGDSIRKSNNKLDKNLFLSFENLQNLDKHSPKYDKSSTNESHTFDKFDLSQNFEEFKLDDCEIEEYDVDICEITEEEIQNDIKIVEEKLASVDRNTVLNNETYTFERDLPTDDITIPGLNKNSIALLKKQLQKSKAAQDRTFQISPQKRGSEPTYEHFLECTGLSSKSILTPSRLLSNHKNMLKPKDVKLRSKVRASNSIERQSLGTVSTTKYWSEPYI